MDTLPVVRKPRIILIGHDAGPVLGGAERSLLDILAAVDHQKYDLSCVLPTCNDGYTLAITKHTAHITVFHYKWWNGTQQGDPETISRFEQIFRRGSVDLVHVNTITLIDPLVAAKNVGVPSILHARELIDPNPELATVLNSTPFDIVQMVRCSADFIIANADATHRLYYKGGRSFRLYNCVDTDAFDMPNEFDSPLKVGIISSNHASKGIEYFVRLAIMAARRKLRCEFLVIGPPTEHSDALARHVHALDVPVQIQFTGYVPDPVEAVRQVNVVVSFSIVPESFGRTLVEAMAARRPVIAFDRGAAPELIRHGKDGFVVPFLDLERTLEYLESLAHSPKLIAAMGRNGRTRAKQLFSANSFALGLNGIYRKILERSKATAQ